MVSAGEEPFKGIDGSVGGLVWVRRRNGSWWPGRILSTNELPDGFSPAPRSGTPVKLLGREDASVDWYNLEKSKRVKDFRCGEYNDCIEKAKASSSSHLSKKAAKYARRDDAILHALELESAPLPSEHCREDLNKNSSDSRGESNSNSAPEPFRYTASFDYPDSKDEGFEGAKKRTRGLEDLGMGAGSGKKRARVGPAQEFLRKKNRRRTLSKVLECTRPMVCVPVECEQPSSPDGPGREEWGPELNESNETGIDKNSDSTTTGVSENDGDGSKMNNDNEASSELGACEYGSCGRLFDVPLVSDVKPQSEAVTSKAKTRFRAGPHSGPTGSTAAAGKTASHWQSKGKRSNFRPRKTEPDDTVGPSRGTLLRSCLDRVGGPLREICTVMWAPHGLSPHRRSRLAVGPKYDGSGFSFGPALYDVSVEVRTGCARPQHVPYVSLTSRLNGRPVTGHPVSVEILEDGLCHDLLLGSWPELQSGSGPKCKPRRSGLLSKKTKKLSSLTGPSHHETKPTVEKPMVGPSVACVPLKLVFSRINATLSGSFRPTPRMMGTGCT